MKGKKLKKPILAEGEVTGHVHELDNPKAEVYADENDIRRFKIDKPTPLKHAEHNTIIVDPKFNIAGRVRIYDPITDEIEKVAD